MKLDDKDKKGKGRPDSKHSRRRRFTEAPNVHHISPVPDGNENVDFSNFSTRYDSANSAIWCWLNPQPRPCMNSDLLDELLTLQKLLTTTYKNQHPDTIWPFRHLVIASKVPGIYNLGGDLELIHACIVNNDRSRLRDYAYKAIDLLQANINNLDLPISMISLVQGQALGAGFEAALSCDVIIAERSAEMGFPEILFNMFPGMGAYNLLTRRIGPALAERVILSGRTYSAEELFGMGLVDVLAEDGTGVDEVEAYIRSHNRSHNTISSLKKIRQIIDPVKQSQLTEIVNIWVDASMSLDKKDLAKMERLLALQKDTKNSRTIEQNERRHVERRGDWRKIKDVSFPLVTHLGENIMYNRRKSDSRRSSS